MSSKKRLLVFHPAIYQYREDYFNALNDAFVLRVCLNPPAAGFNFADLSSRLRFTPHYLKNAGLPGWKRVIVRGIGREINDFRPDIVMVSEYGLTAFRVLLHRFLHRAPYRVITMCDDSGAMLTGGGFSRWHQWALKRLTPRMDEVILVDSLAVEWFQKRYGKGLWMPIIRAEEPFRSELFAARSLAEHTLADRRLAEKSIILYVGRLEPVKNLEMLLRCYKNARRTDSCLVLVGDGSLRESLEKEAAGSSDILFEGWQSGASLYQWFHLAAALVLPSRMEPFGAVVAESLQAGCPALVSYIAGSSCLVDADRTFNPADESALAALLAGVNSPCDMVFASGLRDSLLPISFEQAMSSLIEKISL